MSVLYCKVLPLVPYTGDKDDDFLFSEKLPRGINFIYILYIFVLCVCVYVCVIEICLSP